MSLKRLRSIRRTRSLFAPLALAISVGWFPVVVAHADGPNSKGPPPFGTPIQVVPVTTHAPQPELTPPASDPESPNAKIFEGSGDFLDSASAPAKHHSTKAGDVTLDFVDADVRDVIRSVLGDMLKLPYVIDPQVNGHLTLKTGTPIRLEDILPAFETSLKTVGAALVVSNDMVSIVPIATAQKEAGQITDSTSENGVPGYGIEIVALKYASADQMQKVLDSLVPQGSILRVDMQRNLIFLAGTEPERAAVRATIALFDVDYLKGMSFALIQPQHVDVGELASELGKIFDETSSPIAGLVRMIPISRINTLLVLTSRPSYLHEVSRWVERLDVIPITPGRQLHYYKLQNSRAADIATTLGEVFGTSSGGASHASSPNYASNTQNSAAPSQSQAAGAQQNATSTVPVSSQSSVAAPHSATTSEDAPQIVTDDANNALIIRADAAEFDAIEKVVRQMDVTPNQVLIEAAIVEVTLNDTLKYGVEWAFTSGNQTFTQAATGVPTTSFPGFGFTYTVPNVSVAMSALGTLSKISVLSSPKLLTLDNSPAMLQVGDQVPVITQTAVSTDGSNAPLVSTVQQQNTGVILTVTPRIGNSGMVFLTVSQEVSDAIPNTTSSFTDSPTIEERKIQTTVAIADGTTVALGGLMRRSDSSGNSGVPYLKDIPLLGGLFSARNDTRERTELLVFLTPRVVRSPSAAIAITADLQKGFRNISSALSHLDSKKNDIPRLPWR